MSETEVLTQSPATKPDTDVVGDGTVGLTQAEAEQRLAQYGENALAEHRVSALERLLRFFWGPIPWMIEIAAVLSAVLGHWDDLAIVLAMLFINAASASGRSSRRITPSLC